MSSGLFNADTMTTIYNGLSCGIQVACKALKIGFKAINFLWKATGLTDATAPIIEPIKCEIIDMYTTDTVITKVALGKIEPNGYSQHRFDEMEKDLTPAEIAIISTLLIIQLSLSHSSSRPSSSSPIFSSLRSSKLHGNGSRRRRSVSS